MATGPVRVTRPRSRTVLEVVGGNRVGDLGAAQQRLDHPADPLLLELVRELVQVGLPAEDQLLAGVLDRRFGDRAAAVARRPVVEAGFVGERVHQPRLTPGQLPDRGAGLARKRLAGLLVVLSEQGLDLVRREVSEPQRLGAHVEGAPAGDDRVLRGRPDAVVAHVAHPAQDHALRKPVRALRVAGPELAKDREQGVADERVDLVDHEHERLRIRFGPAGQRLAQRIVGAGRIEDAEPDLGDEPVVERFAGAARERAQDRAHRRSHVLACGLAALDVDVYAAELAAGVQLVTEREER